MKKCLVVFFFFFAFQPIKSFAAAASIDVNGQLASAAMAEIFATHVHAEELYQHLDSVITSPGFLKLLDLADRKAHLKKAFQNKKRQMLASALIWNIPTRLINIAGSAIIPFVIPLVISTYCFMFYPSMRDIWDKEFLDSARVDGSNSVKSVEFVPNRYITQAENNSRYARMLSQAKSTAGDAFYQAAKASIEARDQGYIDKISTFIPFLKNSNIELLSSLKYVLSYFTDIHWGMNNIPLVKQFFGFKAIGLGYIYLFKNFYINLAVDLNSIIRQELPMIFGRKLMDDPISELEDRFAEVYDIIKDRNPNLFKEIQKSFVAYRNYQVPSLTNSKVDRSKVLFNLSNFLEAALAIPLATKPIKFSRKKFNELFAFYDKGLREEFISLIFRQHIFSKNALTPDKVFPVYFVGIPGCGKTVAAENIAKIMEVPIARITLDGATIDNMLGVANEKEFEPGRILSGLVAARKKSDGGENFENMVLFIDEFDRILNANDPASRAVLAFMLKILDPNNRKFYSPFLKTEVTLPSFIILAGNYEIIDEALTNRFDLIKFNGYDPEVKWSIIKKHSLPQIMKAYGLSEVDVLDEDLEGIRARVMSDSNDRGMRRAELAVMEYLEEKLLEQHHRERKDD